MPTLDVQRLELMIDEAKNKNSRQMVSYDTRLMLKILQLAKAALVAGTTPIENLPVAWADCTDILRIAEGHSWSGALWGTAIHPSLGPRVPLYTTPTELTSLQQIAQKKLRAK